MIGIVQRWNVYSSLMKLFLALTALFLTYAALPTIAQAQWDAHGGGIRLDGKREPTFLLSEGNPVVSVALETPTKGINSIVVAVSILMERSCQTPSEEQWD
ncbi:hypothetical protein [Acidicapsa acidisoli]|uniref:hypothetical protein n=1 Tax=Acidicapsa acidisoli TaxID=1615681 RepID=UPI0021DFF856|nr:hypothetical protein [Acidicapsa acidisoli]